MCLFPDTLSVKFSIITVVRIFVGVAQEAFFTKFKKSYPKSLKVA